VLCTLNADRLGVRRRKTHDARPLRWALRLHIRLAYGPATVRRLPYRTLILSVSNVYQTQRSMACFDTARGRPEHCSFGRSVPSHLLDKLSRDRSSISAQNHIEHHKERKKHEKGGLYAVAHRKNATKPQQNTTGTQTVKTLAATRRRPLRSRNNTQNP